MFCKAIVPIAMHTLYEHLPSYNNNNRPFKFSKTAHSANCPLWSCDIHKFGYCHWAWGYVRECLTYWCHILLTDICQQVSHCSL